VLVHGELVLELVGDRAVARRQQQRDARTQRRAREDLLRGFAQPLPQGTRGWTDHVGTVARPAAASQRGDDSRVLRPQPRVAVVARATTRKGSRRAIVVWFYYFRSGLGRICAPREETRKS